MAMAGIGRRVWAGSAAVGAMVAVLLTAGCAGTPAPAKTTPAATRPAVTTPAVTTPAATVSGPITGQELVWIHAVALLVPKMSNVFGSAPTNMTSSALSRLARQLRGCDREAARIGPPTARLQPVYDLLKQACQAYDRGAKCFADAARIATSAGPGDVTKLTQKINCGFAASGPGSLALAQAQEKASEIKAAAG